MQSPTFPQLHLEPASASALPCQVATSSPSSNRALRHRFPSGASLCFAAGALLLGTAAFRRDSCIARKGINYKLPVRQWAPIRIPPSDRRAPEDRIWFRLFCFHPMHLEECVEILDDF